MVSENSLKFQCFSDIPHTLRNYLSEQGWIDIVITDAKKEPDVYKAIKEYEFGVAQPGVLCIKPDKTVLYSWAIIPSKMNLGGAKDRPLPKDIWAEVQKKL